MTKQVKQPEQNIPIKCIFIGDEDSDKDKIIKYYTPSLMRKPAQREHTLEMVDKKSKLKVVNSSNEDFSFN